ncbi:hypothetical protein [Streptomyces luteogriseus]|uniref:hypothetical protein n=1 Tax=Streptomyces luteogriseus TaxID=68233 RepID=UPI00382C2404
MTELLAPPNGAVTSAPAPPTPAARDFSRKRKPLPFTIDGDTFEAATALPGDVFAKFVTLYNGTGDTETYQEQHDLLKQALELALLPESWQLFAARLADKTRPIDDDQMSDVVLWLLEEYGMRPTQPSPPSSDGSASPESGTNSTESTPPEASTSETSQPNAS